MLPKKGWPIFGQFNSTPLFVVGSRDRHRDLSTIFVDTGLMKRELWGELLFIGPTTSASCFSIANLYCSFMGWREASRISTSISSRSAMLLLSRLLIHFLSNPPDEAMPVKTAAIDVSTLASV
jgi:hypothetical protein